MRLFLALSVLFLSLINSAPAAVEAQICGIWQASDGTILQIQTDGQFSKSTGGRTETGTITAIDGKWSLQSNNGKPDSGTFSVLHDSLTLRSSFTSTTTWKRSSAVPPIRTSSTPVPTIRSSTPTLQSSISQSVRQSISQTTSSDPFQSQSQNYGNRSPETIANKPRGRGFRDSVKALVENAVPSPNERANFGNQSRFTGSTAGGGGAGTYSQMRKAFEQEQLNSLPAPRPVSNNPQADETELYGVKSFERRALGPATAVRIKMF